MNNYLLISLFQAFYIIYILRYFKTKVSFHYGNIQSYFIILGNILGIKNDYFEHPIYYSKKPINHVCRFGHQMALLIGLFLIIRCYFYSKNNKNIIKNVNYLVLILIFIGSFMNLNVTIYLIPYFISEIYLNMFLL